jgi:hypothetical protein
MYGLPQAGIIAQQLLEERLAKHGYRQSETTPGLWKHDTRPISFTLVVENAQHLLDAVRQYYKEPTAETRSPADFKYSCTAPRIYLLQHAAHV